MSVETHPMSELREELPTDETRLALDEALTRHNLASFAGIEELYEDLRVGKTAHLLRSPANAERLLTALARALGGNDSVRNRWLSCAARSGLESDA